MEEGTRALMSLVQKSVDPDEVDFEEEEDSSAPPRTKKSRIQGEGSVRKDICADENMEQQVDEIEDFSSPSDCSAAQKKEERSAKEDVIDTSQDSQTSALRHKYPNQNPLSFTDSQSGRSKLKRSATAPSAISSPIPFGKLASQESVAGGSEASAPASQQRESLPQPSEPSERPHALLDHYLLSMSPAVPQQPQQPAKKNPFAASAFAASSTATSSAAAATSTSKQSIGGEDVISPRHVRAQANPPQSASRSSNPRRAESPVPTTDSAATALASKLAPTLSTAASERAASSAAAPTARTAAPAALTAATAPPLRSPGGQLAALEEGRTIVRPLLRAAEDEDEVDLLMMDIEFSNSQGSPRVRDSPAKQPTAAPTAETASPGPAPVLIPSTPAPPAAKNPYQSALSAARASASKSASSNSASVYAAKIRSYTNASTNASSNTSSNTNTNASSTGSGTLMAAASGGAVGGTARKSFPPPAQHVAEGLSRVHQAPSHPAARKHASLPTHLHASTSPSNPPTSAAQARAAKAQETLDSIVSVDVERLLVIEVTHTSPMEIVLRLIDEKNHSERICHLKDDWAQSNLEPGDYVNIIGSFPDRSQPMVLNNTTGLLIAHPDTLITSTNISSSFECQRRAVLKERFKGSDVKHPAMIWGTILHDVMDSAMSTRDFSEENLQDIITRTVPNYLDSLYSVNKTEQEAIEELGTYKESLNKWAKTFLGNEPLRKDGNEVNLAPLNSEKDMARVCISELKDIEELYWAPRFGLKGKIDATVEVKIHRNVTPFHVKSATSTAPLELKSGNPSEGGNSEHRAQVILYALMMSDASKEPMTTGLLHYMKTGQVLGISAKWDDVRSLITVRNHLARYLHTHRGMPQMIGQPKKCEKCYQLNLCTLYHAAVEKGDDKTSGLGQLFLGRTGHLSKSHLEYFATWNDLITLEVTAERATSERTAVWLTDAKEQERLGHCFSHLVIRRWFKDESPEQNRDLPYCYVLTKHSSHPVFVEAERQARLLGSVGREAFKKEHERILSTLLSKSLSAMKLSVGDPVVLSALDGERYGIVTGSIKQVTLTDVMFVTERPIRKDEVDRARIYRLDRDATPMGARTLRSNVASLFLSQQREGPQALRASSALMDSETRRNMAIKQEQLRNLIVDLEPPSFGPPLCRRLQEEAEKAIKGLDMNVDQQAAIMKIITARDYALILGMPGTGKTTTIAKLVNVLVSSNKSVLLTAYMHSAVDNILLKVIERNGGAVLRLGKKVRTKTEIHPYVEEELTKSMTDVGALKEMYDSKMIVATTCLGIDHPIFQSRTFDYCIVDEASQITQAVCLGPIARARTFVLVGDHYQLPPLVQNPEARARGMDVSLFKRLSEAHPEAVVNLSHQYRMCHDVMHLANVLFYSHKLKCGTLDVLDARLAVKRFEQLEELIKSHKSPGSHLGWILEAVRPERRVVFLDTDDVPARESRHTELVRNDDEAQLVFLLVRAFLYAGVDMESMGIISPYRSQLKLISDHLQHVGLTKVEVNTVDKYQGRDKDCIIVSLVRSNTQGNVGDLLRDWRRINVAVTRSKTKLVVLGSRSTLQSSHVFDLMLETMAQENWVLPLPPKAQLTNLPELNKYAEEVARLHAPAPLHASLAEEGGEEVAAVAVAAEGAVGGGGGRGVGGGREGGGEKEGGEPARSGQAVIDAAIREGVLLSAEEQQRIAEQEEEEEEEDDDGMDAVFQQLIDTHGL